MVMALLALGAAVQVRAQSLGDVAREAEAKRKSTKTSGKVYTNDSLRPAPQPSSAPVAAAPAPAPSPSLSGVSPDEKAKEDEQKGEAYWRDRVKAERDALARAEAFAAALDSQINGLYGEFTACQAPPQCNEVAAKRRNAMAERDRVKKEVEDHTKAVTAIQEEARRAGVPAGWVR
jgi:hypothetical protein